MVHCSVPYCKSNSANKGRMGVSFHEYPSNEDLRAKWVRAVARQGPEKNTYWTPSDRDIVCSRHFTEEDFHTDCKRKRLRPAVVPTLFPDYPAYMQPKVVKRRKIPVRQVLVKKKRMEPPTVEEEVARITEGTEAITEEIIETEEVSPMVGLGEAVAMDADPIPPPADPLEGSLPTHRDACVQTKIDQAKFIESVQSNKVMKLSAQRAQSRNRILREMIDELCGHNKQLEEKMKRYNIFMLDNDAENGDSRALFLLEQLQAYGKVKPRWSKKTIKHCKVWRSMSNTAYQYAQKLPLLTLPSATTLTAGRSKDYEACEEEAAEAGASSSGLDSEVLHEEAASGVEDETRESDSEQKGAAKDHDYVDPTKDLNSQLAIGELIQFPPEVCQEQEIVS